MAGRPLCDALAVRSLVSHFPMAAILSEASGLAQFIQSGALLSSQPHH